MTEQSIELARQLAQWLAGTDIELLELSGPGRFIRLRRGDAGVQPDMTAAPGLIEVHSPTATLVRAHSVGVLLHTHPLREEPLVRVGDEVANGQALALLKAGSILLPVTAPRAGVVLRVMAADRTIVGWGEPLFELA